MESILNNLKPISVVPSYASVEEFALYTIASVEESYTNICKEIGIAELSSYMEAAEKKDGEANKKNIKMLLDKFISFAKELWQKIEDLCKKARDRFIVFITDKVKAFTDSKVKLPDLIKAVEASDPAIWNKDVFKTSFVFQKDTAKKIAGNINFVTEFICNKIKSAQKDPEALKEISDNITVNFADKFDNIISINKDMTSTEIQNAVRDAIIIAEKSEVKDPKEYALRILKENGGNLLNKNNVLKEFTTGIADPYNKSKKALDDCIKQAKANDTDKAFQPLFKLATQTTKMSSAVIGGIESAYFKRFAFEYRILLKSLSIYAATFLKKNESAVAAPEVTDETTPTVATESSTFQTELASLFNF